MSYGKEVFDSRGEEFYSKGRVAGEVRILRDRRWKYPKLTSEELDDISILFTTRRIDFDQYHAGLWGTPRPDKLPFSRVNTELRSMIILDEDLR